MIKQANQRKNKILQYSLISIQVLSLLSPSLNVLSEEKGYRTRSICEINGIDVLYPDLPGNVYPDDWYLALPSKNEFNPKTTTVENIKVDSRIAHYTKKFLERAKKINSNFHLVNGYKTLEEISQINASDTPSTNSTTTSKVNKTSSNEEEWAKNFEFVYIGDSIGYMNETSLKSYFPKGIFDSISSRALTGILGGSGAGGLEAIKNHLDDIKKTGHLVVSLGTNDYQLETSGETVEQVFSIVPSEVKVTWLLSASEGGSNGYGKINREKRAETIKDVISKHDNAETIDFSEYVKNNGGWEDWTSDSVHLKESKFDEYSQFHVSSLYQLYGGNNSKKNSSSTSNSSSSNSSSNSNSNLKMSLDHNTGLAIDISTSDNVGEIDSKDLEKLEKIAPKYGFIKHSDSKEKSSKSTSKKDKSSSTNGISGEEFEKAINKVWNDSYSENWQPHVARVRNAIAEVVNVERSQFITYAGHSPSEQLAIDFMTNDDYELGDTIASFLIENIEELNIDYIIWGQKFYMPTQNIYGEANTWNLMPDRGDKTQNHGDHVHVSFKETDKTTKTTKFNDSGDGGSSDGLDRNGTGMGDFGGKVGGGAKSSSSTKKSSNKSNKTTSSNSGNLGDGDWHFRYVGIASAEYITKNEISLDDYLNRLFERYTYKTRGDVEKEEEEETTSNSNTGGFTGDDDAAFTEGTAEYELAKEFFKIWTEEYGASGIATVSIMGNVFGESRFDLRKAEASTHFEKNSKIPPAGAYGYTSGSNFGGGLFQETPYQEFTESEYWGKYEKDDGWGVRNQIGHVWDKGFSKRFMEAHAMAGIMYGVKHATTCEQFLESSNIENATEDFMLGYLRPHHLYLHLDVRVGAAKKFNELFNKSNVKADKSKWKFDVSGNSVSVEVASKEDNSSDSKSEEGCFIDDKESEAKKSGGLWGNDGTGSHNQTISGTFGLPFHYEKLPDDLKPYALDPESVGLKWKGELTQGSYSKDGWYGMYPPAPGQCTELALSLAHALWSKGGEQLHYQSGSGYEVTSNMARDLGGKVTDEPKAGATFSTDGGIAGNHVGIVSHVFENGDILIIEQNVSPTGDFTGSGAYGQTEAAIGEPCTWNYRLIGKDAISSQCGGGFYYPGDNGFEANKDARTVG